MEIFLILANIILFTLLVLLHKRNVTLSETLLKTTTENSYRLWYLENKLDEKVVGIDE